MSMKETKTSKRMTANNEASLFVPILSCVLNQITTRNDTLPLSPNVTVFHAHKPPTISIQDYLQRIVKYAYCSEECFILSLVYLDRIVQRNPNFYITSLNVHRLLITSVMVACKFFDDRYFNNAYYARVGGLSCSELNALEIDFLYKLNFSLHTTPQVFQKYRSELLLNSMQVDRGFFGRMQVTNEQNSSAHHQTPTKLQQFQHSQQAPTTTTNNYSLVDGGLNEQQASLSFPNQFLGYHQNIPHNTTTQPYSAKHNMLYPQDYQNYIPI